LLSTLILQTKYSLLLSLEDLLDVKTANFGPAMTLKNEIHQQISVVYVSALSVAYPLKGRQIACIPLFRLHPIQH